MKYTFDTISVENISANKFVENFHIVDNNADEVFYVSKNIFEHCSDDETENFRYRYVIVLRDYGAFCDDMNNFGAYLYLCPLSKVIAEKLERMGYENVNIETTQYACDAIGEGYGIIFLKDESIEYVAEDDASFITAKQRANECAVIAGSAIDGLDSLRGFYLDRYQNRLGTTGWDMLGEWVWDKGDYIKLTLERYKENEK